MPQIGLRSPPEAPPWVKGTLKWTLIHPNNTLQCLAQEPFNCNVISWSIWNSGHIEFSEYWVAYHCIFERRYPSLEPFHSQPYTQGFKFKKNIIHRDCSRSISPCQHMCAKKFCKLFFLANSNVYMMSTFRQKYFPTHYIYCYLSWLLLLSPLSSGNVGDVVAGAKECWPTRFGSVPRLFTPSSTAVQAQLLTIDDHHGHHCYQWLSLTINMNHCYQQSSLKEKMRNALETWSMWLWLLEINR